MNQIIIQNRHTEIRQSIAIDSVQMKANPDRYAYGNDEEKIYINFYQRDLLPESVSGYYENLVSNHEQIIKKNMSSIEISFNQMGFDHVMDRYNEIVAAIKDNDFVLKVSDDPDDDNGYGQIDQGSYSHGYRSFFIHRVIIKYIRDIKILFRVSMGIVS